MSDEERDEHNQPREGESELDWFRRQSSPELRWLYLFDRLTSRVETVESRGEANEREARRRAEDTQRNIEFIVRQQAQFTADLQALREVQARAEQKWERTAEGISALLAIAEMHEREIGELREAQAEAQAAQAEAQARTDAQMSETDRRMAETDERLNALINTVERIISERRNGGREEPGGADE